MSNEQTIELSLEQIDDYEFRVCFAGAALEPLHTDEAPPLGHDAGPNPSRLLTAAVANCLAASLLFSLHKFKNDPGKLSARARATLERNSERFRIQPLNALPPCAQLSDGWVPHPADAR